MNEKTQIRYLSDRKAEVTQVARWIFDEWGYSRPGQTLADFAQIFQPRVASSKVPLTLVGVQQTAEGEALVATASLVACDMMAHPELTPWLSCLYVRADQRGQGLGDLLTESAVREAERLGFSRCYLWTDKWETYYADRGWVTLSRETYRGENAIVMYRGLGAELKS